MNNLTNLLGQGLFSTLHNVRLVAVKPDDQGREALDVELAGNLHTVLTGFPFQGGAERQVGAVGSLSTSIDRAPGGVQRVYFLAYQDQSLRRAPEFDAEKDAIFGNASVGWHCDSRGPFRAPAGLIPGDNGGFVDDRTKPVTLQVPPEFDALAWEFGLTATELLRGFIADAAGISSMRVSPRADGYSSNGSDERDMASDYVERAHGHLREDAAEFQQGLEERQMADEGRAEYEEQMADLLETYMDREGDPAKLVAILQAEIDKQAADAG